MRSVITVQQAENRTTLEQRRLVRWWSDTWIAALWSSPKLVELPSHKTLTVADSKVKPTRQNVLTDFYNILKHSWNVWQEKKPRFTQNCPWYESILSEHWRRLSVVWMHLFFHISSSTKNKLFIYLKQSTKGSFSSPHLHKVCNLSCGTFVFIRFVPKSCCCNLKGGLVLTPGLRSTDRTGRASVSGHNSV